MKTDTKPCEHCGGVVVRRTMGRKRWAERRFCSLVCSGKGTWAPHYKVIPLADRFWPKVDKRGPDECWPWTACLDDHGYGMVHVDNPPARGQRRKMQRAHIASFRLSGGETTKERPFVLHTCDNPPCCNPGHLYAGTPKDNVDDREKRGRSNRRLGEAHGNHTLTDEAIRVIRAIPNIRGSGRELAKRFMVSESAVSAVRHGRTWRHVA